MATVTETLTVATLEANADGVSVSAAVRKEGRRYVIVIDGHAVDSTTELRAAYQVMASAVRRQLPRGNPTNWGVAIRCNTTAFSLAYGNRSGGGGGGGGEPNPCVRQAIARYRESTLHHALEHAAATLGSCCS